MTETNRTITVKVKAPLAQVAAFLVADASGADATLGNRIEDEGPNRVVISTKLAVVGTSKVGGRVTYTFDLTHADGITTVQFNVPDSVPVPDDRFEKWGARIQAEIDAKNGPVTL